MDLFTVFNEVDNTCYHEAGHAVVAYAFGHSVTSVGVCRKYRKSNNGVPSIAVPGVVEHNDPAILLRSVETLLSIRSFQVGCHFRRRAGSRAPAPVREGSPQHLLERSVVMPRTSPDW